MKRNYQKRSAKEYNKLRGICQWITCTLIYGTYYRLVFNLKIEGRENVPKKGFFIVASNHTSAIDPFLIIHATQRHIAYMAKIELFKNAISRFFMNLLGAFAVDRAKLSVSTVKTVLNLKQTDWCLGIFPQGTREKDGNMDNIGKGFATFAKTLKCDILPVAITGFTKDQRKAFRGKMKIKIGKPIPYNDDVEEMMALWSQKITELSEGKI